jgi:hypothetical protein
VGLIRIPSEAEQRKVVRRRLILLGVIQHKKLSEDIMKSFSALNEAVKKAGISFKDLERNLRGLQTPSRKTNL